MKYNSLFFMIFIAVIAVGCSGWESNGPEYLRDAYGTSCNPDASKGPSSDASVSTKPEKNIAGKWAMRITQKGTFAPVGETWDITDTEYMIAQIPYDGSGLYLTFCDEGIRIKTPQFDPNDPTKENPLKPVTHISQATKDAAISIFKPFAKPTLDKFPALKIVWVWGVTGLKNPEKDPLPTSADDSKVWDQDNDGNPGITVDVEKPVKGKRYMVRRFIWDLAKGTVDKSFLTISGTLNFKIDEGSVGATDKMLETLAPITPNKNGNTYLMKRVPVDFTCTDLMSDTSILDTQNK